jgi:hypothetical protein
MGLEEGLGRHGDGGGGDGGRVARRTTQPGWATFYAVSAAATDNARSAHVGDQSDHREAIIFKFDLYLSLVHHSGLP